MLYELVGSSWLPYFHPSSWTNAIMEVRLQVGYGGVKKTMNFEILLLLGLNS